jgi:hypothetical protein
MPRWLRIVRGMIGTGLAFMVGGTAVGFMFAVPFWLLGRISAIDTLIALRFGVVAFPIGVVFSGLLALTARGKTLEKLSVRRVAALGAGVGLAYFALISRNGIGVWSLGDALINLTSLTVLGGGSAAAILLIARRATSALSSSSGSPEVTPQLLESHDASAHLAEHAARADPGKTRVAR